MLVIDTSVLLAAADNADPDHEPCIRAIQDAGPLVTTSLVVAETAYLIGRQLGATAEAGFFRAIAAGEIQVEPTTSGDARTTLLSPRDRDLTTEWTSVPFCRRDPQDVPSTIRLAVVGTVLDRTGS